MYEKIVKDFFNALTNPEQEKLISFFHPEAMIFWPNTNEMFTPSQFAESTVFNPVKWNAELLYLDKTISGRLISVCKVFSEEASFRVVSFYDFLEDKITSLTEYWSEDGQPPEWRKAMNLYVKSAQH